MVWISQGFGWNANSYLKYYTSEKGLLAMYKLLMLYLKSILVNMNFILYSNPSNTKHNLAFIKFMVNCTSVKAIGLYTTL